ncbi:S53 family peptidase [Nocardioides acrostichi]|uniref:S8/S53 family peptidase n=1 Tax=Nocardioides acrostichi TaxID=2784339 RepID=A0A930YB69_9ACTN|nr:S53 family peptidase [Nocardioides acrostichi]MBF4160194.1 S8/S53 family peptidase [Nocardioides acrostichi]
MYPTSPRRWKAAATAALAAGALLVTPAAGAAVAHTASRRADTQKLTRDFTYNLLPGLSQATDLGAAPAATPMHLVVSLDRPHLAAERRLITAMNTPGNAHYGHFLTPARFARRFGVPAAQQARVTQYFTDAGLSVDHVSRAGDVLSLSGTSSAVSSAFHTPIDRFRTDGTTFLANTAAPSYAKGLGISNVVGLNTLQAYRTTTGPHTHSGTAATTSQDSCLPTGDCIGSTTPQDLWKAYQQPARWKGQKQGVAVFGEGQSKDVIADLRDFETANKLPRVPVRVKHPKGDSGFSDDSGRVEWNIDTQASTGMAPKVGKLTLYFGKDLSDADVDAVFSQFADDAKGPLQASASYGECESIPYVSDAVAPVLNDPTVYNLPAGIGIGNASDATLTPITQQIALEGKTVFVSTGDTGSSCPVAYAAVIGAGNGVLNQGVPITNSPASLPYVTAVGGTVLYTDGQGRRTHEYGWAFGGGGSTLFIDRPDYQKGVANNAIPCVTTGNPCRGIADVAAQSGDALSNGYLIKSAGQDSYGGGTSLSAPLMQGMWARIQSASKKSRGNGFANYGLYRAGTSNAAAKDYFDVTSTDTSTGVPATNGLYPTTPGWDYVTGWGTPKVKGLICTLDRRC